MVPAQKKVNLEIIRFFIDLLGLIIPHVQRFIIQKNRSCGRFFYLRGLADDFRTLSPLFPFGSFFGNWLQGLSAVRYPYYRAKVPRTPQDDFRTMDWAGIRSSFFGFSSITVRMRDLTIYN